MTSRHSSRVTPGNTSKVKGYRFDPEVLNALETTAKLAGLSTNAVVNYAVSNTLANLTDYSAFGETVLGETPNLVAQVRDNYSETIAKLSGNE